MSELLIQEIKKFGKSSIFIAFFGFHLIMISTSLTILNGIIIYNNKYRTSFCDNFYLFANESDVFGSTVDNPMHSEPFEECCKVCFQNKNCNIISRSESACYFKNESNIFERKRSRIYFKNTMIVPQPSPSPPYSPHVPPAPRPPFTPNQLENLKIQCLNTFLCETNTQINTQTQTDTGFPIIASQASKTFEITLEQGVHSITFSRFAQQIWKLNSPTISFCVNPLASNNKVIIIEDIESPIFDIYCRYSQNWNQEVLIDTSDTVEYEFYISARIEDTFFKFVTRYDDLNYKLQLSSFIS